MPDSRGQVSQDKRAIPAARIVIKPQQAAELAVVECCDAGEVDHQLLIGLRCLPRRFGAKRFDGTRCAALREKMAEERCDEKAKIPRVAAEKPARDRKSA